jgi:hypothetical protein
MRMSHLRSLHPCARALVTKVSLGTRPAKLRFAWPGEDLGKQGFSRWVPNQGSRKVVGSLLSWHLNGPGISTTQGGTTTLTLFINEG